MQIELLAPEHIDLVADSEGGNGWKSSRDHWVQLLEWTRTGDRAVLVARSGDVVCGYGSLLWQSGHAPFRAALVPEIHDIATATAFRRQGVARQLIEALEQIAVERGHQSVGLGVGLYADYGPAQRLYVTLGYVPDGRGVTYRSAIVRPGSAVAVDDDLVLWLVRKLGR